MDKNDKRLLKRERWQLLVRIEDLMEGPMVFLGFAWLVLLLIELTHGLNPALENISLFIWGIFILDFLIKFTLAPRKTIFLKKNVLTMISLVVPALRVAKIFRFFRVLRGVRLVKVMGSINRSMRSLAATMSRRAFGYVVLLSVIVILAGSAGMYALEKEAGLETYGSSLWFTSMVVLTVGTDYWPQTPEGRVLCYILALYGFAILGYVTATLATFFIGRDAEEGATKSPADIKALKKEIIELKELVKSLKRE